MEMPILSFSLPSSLNFDSLINKPVLLFGAIIFFIIYFILSGVLRYHWHNYGMRNVGIIFAQSLFFLISIVLFAVLGLTIYYF
ncbi:MAG TPA: hypothetical protein PLZ99_01810 [Parcubacteria group bacterium]|jgi:hypothetical protein|nr:hypothetical protein [Parcubacteria group bacterium]